MKKFIEESKDDMDAQKLGELTGQQEESKNENGQ